MMSGAGQAQQFDAACTHGAARVFLLDFGRDDAVLGAQHQQQPALEAFKGLEGRRVLETAGRADGLLESRAERQVLRRRLIGRGAVENQCSRGQRIDQAAGHMSAHAGGDQADGTVHAQVPGHGQCLAGSVGKAGAQQVAAALPLACEVEARARMAVACQKVQQRPVAQPG